MTTYPVPSGKTARRLEWPFLPPQPARLHRAQVRVARGGGRVAGRRLHAGLRVRADLRGRVAALREGRLGQGAAGLRRVLPRGGPQARGAAREHSRAPRLLWLLDDDWVVLGLEYVDGRNPERPWRTGGPRRLPRGAARRWRPTSRPRPTGWRWTSFADELGALAGYWDHVRGHASRDLPAPRRGGGAGGRVRRGHGRRHRRAHRPARRQLPDRRPTAGSGRATGTGRSSAPPGWTPCSC